MVLAFTFVFLVLYIDDFEYLELGILKLPIGLYWAERAPCYCGTLLFLFRVGEFTLLVFELTGTVDMWYCVLIFCIDLLYSFCRSD